MEFFTATGKLKKFF